MAFTARHEDPIDGLRMVSWDRGRLDGDPDLVARVEAAAQDLEGSKVGPHEGPYTFDNHLASDLSALIIMAQVLPGATFTGEVPERPAIPEGAVG